MKDLKNKSKILFLYIFFGLISTLINLLSQWVIFTSIKHDSVFEIAVLVGTFMGLIVKYGLDKKWIFNYLSMNLKENTRTFLMYSLMGVFTTMIFWTAEYLFYTFIKFNGSQYVGAFLGLSIGYYLKYLLDKKYVFTK